MRRLQAEDAARRPVEPVVELERLASSMLAKDASPKTVRNVMTFLRSVSALAVRNGWALANPVAAAPTP